MKKQIFLVFFLLNIFLINGAAVKEISCENFKTDEDIPSEGHKECFLMNQTVINSPGFVLISPTDENVVAIKFPYNKKIKYLPQSVHEAFPALTIYDAAACAIKSISNVNFANLGKLTTIFLDGNLIESLENGTFEGLNSLKRIFISYNKIKFIHAEVFNGLQNLERVDLFNNICINDDFNTEEKLKTLEQAVSDKCQVSTSVKVCEDEVKYLRVLLELKQRKIEELEKQLE